MHKLEILPAGMLGWAWLVLAGIVSAQDPLPTALEAGSLEVQAALFIQTAEEELRQSAVRCCGCHIHLWVASTWQHVIYFL